MSLIEGDGGRRSGTGTERCWGLVDEWVDGGVESGDAGIRCHSVGGFVCNMEIIT